MSIENVMNQKEQQQTSELDSKWRTDVTIHAGWKAKVEPLDFTKVLKAHDRIVTELLPAAGLESVKFKDAQEFQTKYVEAYQLAMMSDKSISLTSSVAFNRDQQATLFDFSVNDDGEPLFRQAIFPFESPNKQLHVAKKPGLVLCPVDLLRGLLLQTATRFALVRYSIRTNGQEFDTPKEMGKRLRSLIAEVSLMLAFLKIKFLKIDNYDWDVEIVERLSSCLKSDQYCARVVCSTCHLCYLHNDQTCKKCKDDTDNEISDADTESDDKKKKDEKEETASSSSSSAAASPAAATATTAVAVAAVAAAPVTSVTEDKEISDKKLEGFCGVPSCGKTVMDDSYFCTTHTKSRFRCPICKDLIAGSKCEYCNCCMKTCCDCFCKVCKLHVSECHKTRENGSCNGCSVPIVKKGKKTGKFCSNESACCVHKRCEKHALVECRRDHLEVTHGNSDNNNDDDESQMNDDGK